MKKFRFTLEKMRGFREQTLETQKNKLAQLRYAQTQLEEKIQSMKAAFAQISQTMHTEQQQGMPAYKLRSYNLQLDNIRNQLDELYVYLRKAQAAVEQQLQKVVLAQQEVAKLDKLEERQFEEYQENARKAEAAFIEEMVSSGYIRGDSE